MNINWKSTTYGGLLLLFALLFLAVTVGFAQETGSDGIAIDKVVLTPDDIASGEVASPDKTNQDLQQPALGGESGSAPSIEPAAPGDEVDMASNAQILADGGEVTETAEDLLAQGFDEPAMGGTSGAEPRFAPDDIGGGAEIAADAN